MFLDILDKVIDIDAMDNQWAGLHKHLTPIGTAAGHTSRTGRQKQYQRVNVSARFLPLLTLDTNGEQSEPGYPMCPQADEHCPEGAPDHTTSRPAPFDTSRTNCHCAVSTYVAAPSMSSAPAPFGAS